MKKLLGILVLGLFFCSNSFIAEAANTNLVKGQTYEGEISWHRYNIKLPPGEWTFMYSEKWFWSDLDSSDLMFVQLEGKLISKTFYFGEFNGRGRIIGEVAQFVHEILFKDKYDGCYERSEYHLVKTFVKGMSINCLIISHFETRKIYEPDDPKKKTWNARLRKWIRDNNVELPPIILWSDHCYFAPVVRDTLVCFEYGINPELHGASKSEFITEETSEYHRANINRYPDKKKYMEEWVKLSAYRHRLFEEQVGAKDHHKLDLDEYLVDESILATQTQGSKNITSTTIVDDLTTLNNLYKEGALTKEEFEKAKKKLINQ